MESVVVAHGLWMPGWDTAVLRRRLQVAGFAPHLFRFPTVRETLASNAASLARFSADVPGDRVHFVGHSLGGVVTLIMLASQSFARVGRIVCLGSPLKGSRVAASMARSSLGRRMLGKSVIELLDRGGLDAWSGSAPLGVIAGSRSFGAGRLLGGLPVPNDGTVAVDETQLGGVEDHLVLPVTHTALLFSREVADQTTRFLRDGRFRH